MDRTVRLVLVDGAGAPLGALPAFAVPEPWWQEVAGVVAGARTRFGVELAVLRLLAAELPEPPGGAVTFLAQLDGDPPPGLAPVAGLDLSPHPLRAPYAEPGGPARSLAWAEKALAGSGWAGMTATQLRTWNLSAIWRLDECPPLASNPRPGSRRTSPRKSPPPAGSGPGPTRDISPQSSARAAGHPAAAAAGPRGAEPPPAGVAAPRRAWLKQVPWFYRHEAAVLRWLAGAVPGAAPVLLATGDEGRILVEDAPGEDGWNAGPAERDAIAAVHHRIQVASLGAVDALVAAGVPDRRGHLLAEWVRDRLTAWRPAPGEDVPDVARLLDDLDARIAAVQACGLPESLVHGDLHGGNARLGGGPPVVIDWADAVVGNPAGDILRLTERLDGAARDGLIASWAARWRRTVPGCEPERAVRLWRPVSELYLAAVYAAFVAGIEPSERPYHAGDVAPALRRAAACA